VSTSSSNQASPEPFRATVRTMLRDRLLDAAAGVFATEGWSRLTMAKVADRAGVSRQTVYNEFGAKPQLAEQLVMRELDTFLDIVRQRFEAEDELVPAVRAAVEGALVAAERNPLLRAVLEGSHGGDTELLPFIFQSLELIDTATSFLTDLVRDRFSTLPVEEPQLRIALESVVRLVLSHISRPSHDPQQTADDVAFVVDAVLSGLVGRLP
jgi:AcrR family transcriptional regulator